MFIMNERKEQGTFFERALIEDPEYAKTVYENESIRFRIKLMFTACIAVITLMFYIIQIGVAGFSFVGISGLLLLPIVYAIYKLYQAYADMKDAKEFLEACVMMHV